MDDIRGQGHWADRCDSVALTGVGGIQPGWGMSRGQVGYSLPLPGHNGVLMSCAQDAERVGVRGLRHKRIVADAR